ncbi:Antizyme inhibitor 2 [Smittium mucronatum]|uniref:ornithine decarboxylase n=1 Tax=Smittium mucronatum TaxID=133383 RepID=A0A1R0H161_9FUNG|nr:Antizyme inhibitor 2 [Smittium mucronatum]
MLSKASSYSSVRVPSLDAPNSESSYLSIAEIMEGKTLVPSSMSQVLEELTMAQDSEDSFFIADVAQIAEQHKIWVSELPRIHPHFAVKSNPDPVMIKMLANLGTGFDCASKTEIKLVLDAGVSPDRIIYAHPCKPTSHLVYARQNRVSLMTFDNRNELYKIKAHYPDAKIVLRISTDDSNSLCRLSLKFGASMDSVQELIETAHELDLDLVGVSFHVGSGCNDDTAFTKALMDSRKVFDLAAKSGYKLSLLDIGGGFPSPKQKSGVEFKTIASNIRSVLDDLFPVSENIRIISEPGRFFSSSPFSLAVNITSKRQINSPASFMYYINDGVYGSFNCIMFDHQVVFPEPLVVNGSFIHHPESISSPTFQSSIWGPTCDSIDCVVSDTQLPEFFVGDWILFQNMGAYTGSAASKFNGFDASPVYYYNSSS